MLTNLEKEFLRALVKREQEEFAKTKKSLFMGMSPQFLKAEHEFADFLSELEKKLR